MAEPVQFPEANSQWYGAGDVGNLPVWRDLESGQSISCWELSAEEQMEVLATGKIWLRVWGQHPATALEGTNPFVPVADE